MVVPVGKAWLLARQRGKIALQEVAEALPRGVDIFAVAKDEIHRHIEHIVDIAFIAETLVEHEGQHAGRSEEHTSELQSLMRISYAVFCLKKKKKTKNRYRKQHNKQQQ